MVLSKVPTQYISSPFLLPSSSIAMDDTKDLFGLVYNNYSLINHYDSEEIKFEKQYSVVIRVKFKAFVKQ